MLIENGIHVDMGESGSAFNTRPSESENFNFGVGEDHLNSEEPVVTFSTSPPFTTTPHFNTATADVVGDDDIDVGYAGPDFSKEEVKGSDYSTKDSVESEAELVGDDDEEEYGSDVHEEVWELRAEKRSFQRRTRRKRVAADNEKVPVGEAGPDLGFDETGTTKIAQKSYNLVDMTDVRRIHQNPIPQVWRQAFQAPHIPQTEDQFGDYEDEFEEAYQQRNKKRAPRVRVEDDNLSSITMKIPTFKGTRDPDLYLDWERKVEAFFDPDLEIDVSLSYLNVKTFKTLGNT
ncbi:hypothetical protein RDI58_029544 [Solanum bulbocastanum]|uniref:Uncharacterized protein n=1 Tax=Solanum bulbocastanum TaxID=147425 RepID=A0AAN8SRY3_SOLBU